MGEALLSRNRAVISSSFIITNHPGATNSEICVYRCASVFIGERAKGPTCPLAECGVLLGVQPGAAIAAKATSPQRMVRRCRIILLRAEGIRQEDVAYVAD